jgi:hypothetical protein
VLSSSHAAELRKVEPLGLDGARERFGARISDEELLLRLTMPAEQVDAMLAGSGEAASAAGARRGEDPLVWLLREVSKREVGYMRLQTDEDLVVWRRAA